MVSLAAVDNIFDEFNLTPREREVARLILRGHKGSEIMTTLKMALGTFRTHKRMILTKAGVRAADAVFGRCIHKGRRALGFLTDYGPVIHRGHLSRFAVYPRGARSTYLKGSSNGAVDGRTT